MSDSGMTSGPVPPAVDVSLPGGRDLGRALRIYVAGRNRFWTADEKRQAAERPRSGRAAEVEAGPTGREPARASVPVPETLDFHRAAGIWRDDLPGRD